MCSDPICNISLVTVIKPCRIICLKFRKTLGHHIHLIFLELFNGGLLNKTLKNSIKRALSHSDPNITLSSCKTKALPNSHGAASHVVQKEDCFKPQILWGYQD